MSEARARSVGTVPGRPPGFGNAVPSSRAPIDTVPVVIQSESAVTRTNRSAAGSLTGWSPLPYTLTV